MMAVLAVAQQLQHHDGHEAGEDQSNHGPNEAHEQAPPRFLRGPASLCWDALGQQIVCVFVFGTHVVCLFVCLFVSGIFLFGKYEVREK